MAEQTKKVEAKFTVPESHLAFLADLEKCADGLLDSGLPPQAGYFAWAILTQLPNSETGRALIAWLNYRRIEEQAKTKNPGYDFKFEESNGKRELKATKIEKEN